MADDKLTPLQHRILHALAGLKPPWTLTGGGALAGIHLGHRTTRDLDLFWRSRADLGHSVTEAVDRLRAAGLDVVTLRTTPSFSELRVSNDVDVCIVDFVAEPFAAIEPPHLARVEGVQIRVDSIQEILAAKLAALLGRTELRDLVDVQALLEHGADLISGLRDAQRKDAGFSAMTLAWVLRAFELRPLALALGWNEDRIKHLDAFRERLVSRLTDITRPR